MVGDNLELEVFSQLEIPAREELTISYLPSVLITLPHRQEKLAATWFFDCRCNRSEFARVYSFYILDSWITFGQYLLSWLL